MKTAASWTMVYRKVHPRVNLTIQGYKYAKWFFIFQISGIYIELLLKGTQYTKSLDVCVESGLLTIRRSTFWWSIVFLP